MVSIYGGVEGAWARWEADITMACEYCDDIYNSLKAYYMTVPFFCNAIHEFTKLLPIKTSHIS